MLSVPVVNMRGEPSGSIEVDPAMFGGEVKPELLKQAIVAYRDHQRQDSARTKGRGDVEGSTRKLYRQKGTGNARVGNIRTGTRRGGGRIFAKRGPRRVLRFPKKMRRLARNNAILSKIQDEAVVVVDNLTCDVPKTKIMADLMRAVDGDKGCLLAMHEHDRNIYLSSRNLPKTEIRLSNDLCAYEILRRKKVIFSKQAFEQLTA